MILSVHHISTSKSEKGLPTPMYVSQLLHLVPEVYSQGRAKHMLEGHQCHCQEERAVCVSCVVYLPRLLYETLTTVYLGKTHRFS